MNIENIKQQLTNLTQQAADIQDGREAGRDRAVLRSAQREIEEMRREAQAELDRRTTAESIRSAKQEIEDLARRTALKNIEQQARTTEEAVWNTIAYVQERRKNNG